MPKETDGSTKLTINLFEPERPQSRRPERSRRIDLSIIIVNFNTGDFLEKCLDSVNQACKTRLPDGQDLACEVFVVDNASTDWSLKKIQNSKFKIQNLKIIENKINLGFAKANNIALKQVKGKYILLLNPDTEVEKDTFEKMIKFMDEKKEAGAATCKVILPNGELDWASHRGFPTPWNSFSYFTRLSKIFPKSKLFAGYHQTYKNLKKVHEISSPSGTFYMVRKEVVDKIGLLDEDYFMFGEDLDWSYRIKQAGYKIFYTTIAKVLHYKGIASGIKEHSFKISPATYKTRMKAAESFYDTMKIFYEKHYQEKYPKFIKWLTFLGIDLLKNRRLAKLQGIA